jgi:4'-phosphopantetheinyl transferase
LDSEGSHFFTIWRFLADLAWHCPCWKARQGEKKMTPIEREPPPEASFDLAIARCMVASGLTFACATVSDQLAPATMAALERLLDDDERAIYQGVTDPADRRCFVAVRGLLRIELSFHLALSPQDWQYVSRPGRQPEIRTPLGRVDKFHFSLSHTRGMVACAVTDASAGPYQEVGIDVEWVRPMPGMRKLAEEHFAPAEVAALRALPPDAQLRRFLSLWTLRQAWAKARCPRSGFFAPEDDQAVFTFDESGNIPQATFPAGGGNPQDRWCFWLHALDDAHVLSLAVRQRELFV